jgi:hypothetical protein
MPHYFLTHYLEAKTHFLETCRSRQATIHSYPLRIDNQKIPTELTIDTARLGPSNASKALVIISGTHGVEGFCGSACQLAFVASESSTHLPADISVFMIHALNPYGFAELRRVDAQNIDVNRNFVEDFNALAEYNLDYEQLNSGLNPTRWSEADPQEGDGEIASFIATHGAQKFQEAVSIGQYRHAKGLFFGGKEKTWSRSVLEEIVEAEFSNTRALCAVDYHTGLGPHGVGELISFASEESDEYKRSVRWFGAGVKSTKGKATEVKSVSADVGGPIDKAFRGKGRTVTFAALEFGTVPIPAVLRALRAENWLHHYGNVDSTFGKKIKDDLKSAFHCSEINWQSMVLNRSAEVLQQALAGLDAS